MTDTGPLLVPIQLDAIVIVPKPTGPIRRPKMNYNKVRYFATPEPKPFEGVVDDFTESQENQGVYLMWTLPAALRHGVQPDPTSGAVEFPLVPNRWLVVRFLSPRPGGQTTTTAWIVESDYLNPDRGKATSPYLDPAAKTPTPTFIGRKLPLTGDSPWVETDPGSGFLRAVGPGNPSFAAFQPHNENVFSIHDDGFSIHTELAAQGAAAGTLDYFVAGWYSNPASDPLHGWKPDKDGGYAGLLKSLQWLAPDPAGRAARSSIYHGLTLGLDWEPEGQPPKSARDHVRPKIALGNTSTDALVALLKAKGLNDSDAELLETFTLDLLGVLEQPGGDAILQRELHASWFASAAGGVQWQIVDRPTAPGAPPPDPPSGRELEAEQKWLAWLNADQQELDRKRRQLASLQRELYELWWKWGYANADEMPPGISAEQFRAALDPTRPNSPAARIRQLIDEVAAGQGALPDPTADSPAPKQATAAASDPAEQQPPAPPIPDTRQLTAGLAPRFFEPSDPVLVIAGLGHDLVVDPAAQLSCRYPDAVLTAIAARRGAQTVVLTVRKDEGERSPNSVAVPPVAATGLSPAITALLAEFALLRAFYAAQAADKASSGRAPSAADVVRGTLPELPLKPWQQAWLPLYLEWQANWRTLPYHQQGKAQWNFDGHDFALTGTPPAAPPDDSPWGRALLTPGLAFAVRSRLEQYLDHHPSNTDLKTLEDHVNKISEGWDFLSQTLDGLTTQIAWRDPWAARAPDATIGRLVGDNYRTAPQPRNGESNGTGFEGMRAGRLELTRVSIVDRFGQTLDLLGRGATDQTEPSIAASLTPRHRVDGAVAELPPRLLQGGRLRITAASPGDDPARRAAGVSPLCGFLVPNHIDRALAAYDATGRPLGELRLVATAGKANRVVWDPAPLAAPATLDGLKSDLAAVLRAVADAGPAAFHNLLTTIDETLWTIDPLASEEDEYLTALAGRPLALVHARLALELDGAPLRDPSWPQTFTPVDPPFLRYDFPVRLGAPADRADGLVGYFCQGKYQHFRAVRVPARSELVADPSGFVTAATPNDISLRFDASSAAHVTLLVDPRGQVQAHPGLLPTAVLELSRTALAPALSAISVAFRAGPLLADQPPPQPDGTGPAVTQPPLMPTPTASGRAWSWVEQNGTVAQPVPFPAVDDRARFSTLAPTAREGFVQVDPAGGQPR
jgi:hypothetical protein